MYSERERRRFTALEVLIVDDDGFILRAVGQILRDMGISHQTLARDGEEALDFIMEDGTTGTRLNFDLIICDWMMPGVSGLDVLKAVRERDSKQPFLMLTSKVSKEAILAAKELDVSAYLAKPIVPKELQKKIDSLMVKAGRIPAF